MRCGIVILKDLAPAAKFPGQRGINLPRASLGGIIPESIMAVAIIHPTRVVEDGIEANTVNGNACLDGGVDFLANVAEPGSTNPVLCARFGDEQGTLKRC